MFKWYQIKLCRSYPFNRSLALFLAGLYPSSFVFSHFLPKIQFRLTFSLFLIFCQNQGFYSYKPFNDMNIPSISTISANVREVHMFKIFLKTNRLHWASWYEKQLVEMFCKTEWKTSVRVSFLIRKRLWHSRFHVNFAK